MPVRQLANTKDSPSLTKRATASRPLILLSVSMYFSMLVQPLNPRTSGRYGPLQHEDGQGVIHPLGFNSRSASHAAMLPASRWPTSG
jgi:hypothetical protein